MNQLFYLLNGWVAVTAYVCSEGLIINNRLPCLAGEGRVGVYGKGEDGGGAYKQVIYLCLKYMFLIQF
jgi:hypothetical protein